MSEREIEGREASAVRVLVLDDDPLVCESICSALSARGFEAESATDRESAFAALSEAERSGPERKARPFQVVVMDISLRGVDGPALLGEIRTKHPDTVVVILTPYGTIESAVGAIKQGAFDYLTHPIMEDELAITVRKASRQAALLATNQHLRRQLDDRLGLDSIVGRDRRMARVFDLISAVAPTRTTVLMTGESGTGKSLVARAIHRRSQVSDGPFVELSCGSIPETLLESELFGHVKGAFTGANADKVGRFLAADGGTIFLDEINSASPAMQLKLLRVLQERKFEPVGSSTTVEVNVRVILASNQPLEGLVSEGRFRQDLYYRINVVKIELPPLRERSEDIPILAEHFLERFNEEMGRRIAGFTEEAVGALQRYSMPGNVRELQNIVERAVVLCSSGMIDVDDLPPQVVSNRPSVSLRTGDEGSDAMWKGEPLAEALEEQERRVILAALNANGWNRQQTAEQLDINRTTLYKKIRRYGLDDLSASA